MFGKGKKKDPQTVQKEYIEKWLEVQKRTATSMIKYEVMELVRLYKQRRSFPVLFIIGTVATIVLMLMKMRIATFVSFGVCGLLFIVLLVFWIKINKLGKVIENDIQPFENLFDEKPDILGKGGND